MDHKDVAIKIISESKCFKSLIINTKKSIWKSFVFILSDNIGDIESEKDFLLVVKEICISEVQIKTGNGLIDKLVDLTKGTIMRFAISLIDKYFLDRWFGEDWFDKLRGISISLSGKKEDEILELLDEEEVLRLYDQS